MSPSISDFSNQPHISDVIASILIRLLLLDSLVKSVQGKIALIMMAIDTKPKHLNPAYRTALITCALLNLVMLFMEGGVGLWIGSAALLADAVDFLEDAAVLTLALVALRWSVRARATAGLIQGFAMAGVGLGAVIQIVRRFLEGGAPSPTPMGAMAVLALVVNVYCAYRLIRFRIGDASMRAIWLSSRNDAMLNVLTVIAGRPNRCLVCRQPGKFGFVIGARIVWSVTFLS